METIGVVKDILLILALMIGAWACLFIYLKFAPVVIIRISDSWISDKLAILRIEIENISKVRVSIKKETGKKQDANILLQIFQHDKNNDINLTEFIPFTENWFKKKKYPADWKDAEIIFETTEWIYPGEVITIERPVHSDKNKILHVGVQVHAKFGIFELAKIRHWSQRWTSARFLTNKEAFETKNV